MILLETVISDEILWPRHRPIIGGGGVCYLWPERPAILICQDVRQDAGLVSEGCLIQELERLRCLKCSHIFFFLFFFLLFSCVFFSFFFGGGDTKLQGTCSFNTRAWDFILKIDKELGI